jgi:hypothetical protein
VIDELCHFFSLFAAQLMSSPAADTARSFKPQSAVHNPQQVCGWKRTTGRFKKKEKLK